MFYLIIITAVLVLFHGKPSLWAIAHIPSLWGDLLIPVVDGCCLLFFRMVESYNFGFPSLVSSLESCLPKQGFLKHFLHGPTAASGHRLVWKREICIMLSLMQHILREDNQFSLNIIVLCSAQHKLICHLLLAESSEDLSGFSQVQISIFIQEFVEQLLYSVLVITQKILLIYPYTKKGWSRHGFYSVSFSCQATAMRYEWLYGSLDLVSFGHTRFLICLRRSCNWSVWCMESNIGYIH